MSSKTKSLKSKLLLRYSLLFGTLALLTFILIYKLVDSSFAKKADENLKKFLQVYEISTATGSKFDWILHKMGAVVIGDIDNYKENPAIFAIYNKEGQLINKSYGFDIDYSIQSLFPKAGSSRDPYFSDAALKKEKVYRVMLIKFEGKGYLLAALPRDFDLKQLDDFRNIFIFSGLLLFLGGLAIAWFTLSSATTGLERTRQLADLISSEGDYKQRIQIENESLEVDSLARSFNQMLDHTETLLEELEQVSNNVAHDLRTPITRLKTLAQTSLLQKGDALIVEDFASKVLEECVIQSEIIETVLTIAGIESSINNLDKQDFDIVESLEKLRELYDAAAEAKGLKITLINQLKGKYTFKADRKKLDRAFANLIDNAVKYTEKGIIELTIREQDKFLLVEIKDSGIGIASEDQEKVFKRFYRCDSSRTKAGNGLGLSLALAVVEAHEGKINVESSAESGTLFRVILPLSS